MASAAPSESELSRPALAFRRAVEVVGSQVAMAQMLGVTQGAVSKRISEGKPCPHRGVLKVEAETGISRYVLRPDVFGAAPAPADADASHLATAR